MHRIDSAGTAAAMPAPAAVGATVGYFTKGNPGTGTPATVVDHDWLNSIQEELIGILTAAGIAPDKTVQNQLAAALSRMTGGGGAITNKAFADSPYAGALGSQQVVWDTAGGNVVHNLPAAAGAVIGKRFTIIKSTGDVNTVSVTPNGTDQIDGVNAAEVISDQWAAKEYLCIAAGKWVTV